MVAATKMAGLVPLNMALDSTAPPGQVQLICGEVEVGMTEEERFQGEGVRVGA